MARVRAAVDLMRVVRSLAADGKLDRADVEALVSLRADDAAWSAVLTSPELDDDARAHLRAFIERGPQPQQEQSAAQAMLSQRSLRRLMGEDADAIFALARLDGKQTLHALYRAAARGAFGPKADTPITYAELKRGMKAAGLGHAFMRFVDDLPADKRKQLMNEGLAPTAAFACEAEARSAWRNVTKKQRYRDVVVGAARAGRLDDVERAAAREPERLFSGRLSPAEIVRAAEEERGRDVDVVIIGAGMAGLAAAQELMAKGKSVVVLEASDRVGGRTKVDEGTFDIPFDLGAAWLHGAPKNPLTPIAEKLGFTTVEDHKQRKVFGTPLEPDEAGAVVTERLDELVEKLVESDDAGLDVATSKVFPPRDAFDRAASMDLAQLSMGLDAENLSSRDAARQIEEIGDRFVREGLGSVVTAFSHGVPVRLKAPVEKVEWGDDGVKVTAGGGVFRGRTVLVTASPAVIASNKIEFDPPLPAWKQTAARGLPMGSFNKIALAFNKDVFAGTKPTTVVFDMQREDAAQFLVKPMDTNMVVGFVGGSFAQELEEKGEQAAIDYALSRLRKIYGPKIDEAFVRGLATSWGKEPWALGAFPSAKPGMQRMRKQLMKPIRGRIFFAGDAGSELWGGCLPGAYLTGRQAARAIANVGRGHAPGQSPFRRHQ